MPYTPTVGDIFEAKVFTYNTLLHQVGVNVIHYICAATAGTPPDQDAMATAIDSAAAPLYKGVLSPDSHYYGVTLSKIWPFPTTVRSQSNVLDGVGTLGAGTAPGQLSMVLTKQSAGAGRSKRGRVYIPFPPASMLDVNGLPKATYLTAATLMAPLFKNSIIIGGGGNTTTLTNIIYNRVSHGGTTVLNIRVNDVWGTQRRRGEYGRINVIPPF